MADGDEDAGTAASSIGLAVMTGLEKVRHAWRFINSTRDMIAAHITTGTHPASAINSGTLDAARIPTLDAAKIGTGTLAQARIPSGIPASKVTGPWTGAVDTNNNVECTNIIATGSYNNDLASSWRALYVDSGGAYGIVPSSARFKRDIEPRDVPPALLAVQVMQYHYIRAVEQYGLTEAPLEVSPIAEQLDELGLREYVDYDEDGKPYSLNDRAVMYDMLALLQAAWGRIGDLETTAAEIKNRLDRLEKGGA